MTVISDAAIRRKKFFILGFGVILFFLTSMSKVLIPATIFDELQTEFGMNASRLAVLGAVYMYAYASSQLLAGVFSDRYGGVRILLIGGGLFTAGTIGFPCVSQLSWMLLFRVLTGFGAGTVFLGVAKLLGDLFDAKFAFALGLVLLLGYFGPTCGTVPMVKLVEVAGWRVAMALPGMAAALALAGVAVCAPGTIKKTIPGQTFAPLLRMLGNRKMWAVCVTSSVIFGAYYVLLAQIGQKSIADFCGVSASAASACVMLLTVMVACNNLGVNALLKLARGRRKVVALAGIFCTLAGALTGGAAFSLGWGLYGVMAGFVLVSFPAGFFPLFGTMARELNPPEDTGLAVALLNFFAFVLIALFQNAAGGIMKSFQSEAVKTASGVVYPAAAYAWIFAFIGAMAFIGLLSVCFFPETRPEK